MSPVSGDLAPTARLRWVERTPPADSPAEANETVRVLQVWWAQDVPAYMRASALGEWRDVEVGIESP